MHSRLVYVVAKPPRVGTVKTRLCPPLRPEQAASLYRGFLLDSLELAARVHGATVRAICPNLGGQDELAALLPPGVGLTRQREPGLGAALEESFRLGLAEGFETVAVMASDNPTLPPELVEQALERVGRRAADVVLGPTEDGGYYLLAARAVHPRLFREMPWSTPSVLDVTLQRCRQDGLQASLVERWYDVDTPEALLELTRRLASLPPECASHTRAALAAVDERVLACA